MAPEGAIESGLVERLVERLVELVKRLNVFWRRDGWRLCR
jgi:hypothetical protein